MSKIDFNVQDAHAGFGLPEGEYLAMAISSETKPTKKGDGEYIQMEFVVTEGEQEGVKQVARFNTKNANPKAEQIGRGQFKKFCECVGVLSPQETEELHEIPVVIRVRTQKDRDDTEIFGFKAATEAPSAPAKPVATKRTPATKTPWLKK